MIPFPFNENQFSFFVADHLLVGQLCTNPKIDRSLLLCLKVTPCSTSEIGDAPLYNSCTLLIQVMTTGPLPAPSKCKSGWFNAWGHSSTHRTTLWRRRWSGRPHHATSYLRSRLESQHQSVPGCAEECGDPLVQSGGRWQTLGVAAGLSAGPQVKETQAWHQKECYDFVPFSHWPPLLEPAGLLRLVIRWEHHQHQTPTTPKPAWSLPSAEYLPSSRRRLWKRHAPSSESVLRLKAATLNRCQLYYIIKLPELIFSIKVLKWSCSVVFFWTTILSFHPVQPQPTGQLNSSKKYCSFESKNQVCFVSHM